jgi:hypothetical protein
MEVLLRVFLLGDQLVVPLRLFSAVTIMPKFSANARLSVRCVPRRQMQLHGSHKHQVDPLQFASVVVFLTMSQQGVLSVVLIPLILEQTRPWRFLCRGVRLVVQLLFAWGVMEVLLRVFLLEDQWAVPLRFFSAVTIMPKFSANVRLSARCVPRHRMQLHGSRKHQADPLQFASVVVLLTMS